jgi:hypothetical protein|nr:hypothetical protein [Neorhizobium tomejilense]
MNQIVTVGTTIGSRLQKAIDRVHDLGLKLTVPDVQPIARVIGRIEDVDPNKITVIARTLTAMQAFDTLVNENLASSSYGERFDAITAGFKSMIGDLNRQINQEEKGGPSFSERFGNVYMKLTRGDVSAQFIAIEGIYKDVIKDSGKTLELQTAILEAYTDARAALKEGEIAAREVFDQMKGILAASKASLDELNRKIEAAPADMPEADRGRLELERDDAANEVRKQDDRYQIAKDMAEMLTVSYSVTETVFGKYYQAHKVLDRLHQKAVLFFDIQRPVLTAMKATYTGIMVVNELSKSQQAMEAGLNDSLENLASLGDTVLREGVRVAHGPGIKASSVRKLVESTVDFLSFVDQATTEGRHLSTVVSADIAEIVEKGKRSSAAFAARAA